MLTEILNGCFAFLVITLVGIFAAGSCEVASERDERKRVQKLIREKYGKTY